MLFPIKIKSIKKHNWSGKIYNLAVEDDETYIAGGIVAHNCRSELLPVFEEERNDVDKVATLPAIEEQTGGFLKLVKK